MKKFCKTLFLITCVFGILSAKNVLAAERCVLNDGALCQVYHDNKLLRFSNDVIAHLNGYVIDVEIPGPEIRILSLDTSRKSENYATLKYKDSGVIGPLPDKTKIEFGVLTLTADGNLEVHNGARTIKLILSAQIQVVSNNQTSPVEVITNSGDSEFKMSPHVSVQGIFKQPADSQSFQLSNIPTWDDCPEAYGLINARGANATLDAIEASKLNKIKFPQEIRDGTFIVKGSTDECLKIFIGYNMTSHWEAFIAYPILADYGNIIIDYLEEFCESKTCSESTGYCPKYTNCEVDRSPWGIGSFPLYYPGAPAIGRVFTFCCKCPLASKDLESLFDSSEAQADANLDFYIPVKDQIHIKIRPRDPGFSDVQLDQTEEYFEDVISPLY